MLLSQKEVKRYCAKNEIELNELEESLIKHEGFQSEYYFCNKILHFGVGHNCESIELTSQQKDIIVTGSEANKIELAFDLLENDIAEAEIGFIKVFNRLSDYGNKDNTILEMISQMGRGPFAGFKQTIKLINAEEWGKAALEAADSKWFREHTKRAKEVLFGFWYNEQKP